MAMQQNEKFFTAIESSTATFSPAVGWTIQIFFQIWRSSKKAQKVNTFEKLILNFSLIVEYWTNF